MWTVFLSMITCEVKGLRTKFNICFLPMIGCVCLDMYTILAANSWLRTKGERKVLGNEMVI